MPQTNEDEMMEKKTKQPTNGDKVKNMLNGNYYPLESVEKSGAGYIVKMTPANLDGNTYFAEYADRHQVQ